jgi:MurNAc alpha-1-phosphate uridylyltransferase
MAPQPKKPPQNAMVLAAGLGLRMRPITDKTPKPMIKVAGRTLLDHALDRLVAVGVKKAVVNTHHLGDQIIDHLKFRRDLEIVISDETDLLLETGGGVKKALAHFGDDPFYIANADVLWLNSNTDALQRLADLWDADKMEALLLLHSTVEAYGYRGRGDFTVDPLGKLARRLEREISPYVFTGVEILHPRALKDTPDGPFSLNIVFDRAIEQDRLYGIVHDGEWFDIGTPDGLNQAEAFMNQKFPGRRRR